MASEERLGYRCPRISQRRRQWGFHVPAVDLDHLVFAEYDRGRAVALIDFKWRTPVDPDLTHPNIRAQEDLATRAGVPFFVVTYDPEAWVYEVFPLNDQARSWLSKPRLMNEKQFVRLPWRLRGRDIPADVLATLNDWPDVAE